VDQSCVKTDTNLKKHLVPVNSLLASSSPSSQVPNPDTLEITREHFIVIVIITVVVVVTTTSTTSRVLLSSPPLLITTSAFSLLFFIHSNNHVLPAATDLPTYRC